MEATNEFDLTNGIWRRAFEGFDKNNDSYVVWRIVLITDVPVKVLLDEWEDLLHELYNKEEELQRKNEEYNKKEFEIVYQSDIDFQSLYGAKSEKVRKQHAKTVLSELNDEINSLELSVNWIKSYIPLLKEVIRSKQ